MVRFRFKRFAFPVACLTVLLLVLPMVPLWESAHATRSSVLGDWVVQSTIPIGYGQGVVYAAGFANELDGYVVGDSGMMFTTHDGGITWNTYNSGTDAQLSLVRFFDASRGVIAGRHVLLSTTNAGQTWQNVPNLPCAESPDVASPVAGTYYVACDYGTVSATTDNGTTWQTVSMRCSGPIVFANVNNGWVGSCHTTDGGLTWQDENFAVDPQCLWIVPQAIIGLFVPDNGTAYLGFSTNGGTSFDQRPLPVAPEEVPCPTLAMASALTGIFASGASTYTTVDGGHTWSQESLPPQQVWHSHFVGFRGLLPFAIVGNQFLHLGPLPATATPSPSPTDVPTSTPTMPLVVPLPSRVPPKTVAYLRINSVTPSSVVAGSGMHVTLSGIGFDSLATISIGADDITTATFSGDADNEIHSLMFVFPPDLPPGVYDVTVTEPDSRSAVLKHGLTVLPQLGLSARLLHATASQGTSAVLLVQTASGAKLSVTLSTQNGHPVPHCKPVLQAGQHGSWRVLLPIDAHLAPGEYAVNIVAGNATQTTKKALSLTVTARE